MHYFVTVLATSWIYFRVQYEGEKKKKRKRLNQQQFWLKQPFFLPHLLTGLPNSHTATLPQPSAGHSNSEESPFLSPILTWISSSLLFFLEP